MKQDTGRAGNFSSSKIYKLMTNDRSGKGLGAPALTYIYEKSLEKKLGRQLEKETTSRSASWGRFVQHRVTNVLLGADCKPTKDIRRAHPTVPNWTGAEDYLKWSHEVVATTEFNGSYAPADIAGEIKCFELKNFCRVHDAATLGFKDLKEECPEVAWQLVSHATLCGVKKVELTLYVPYKDELSAIREEADQGDTPYEFQWIKYATDDELPHLIRGTHYPNRTSFIFTIDKEDIELLTARVELANKMLMP